MMTNRIAKALTLIVAAGAFTGIGYLAGTRQNVSTLMETTVGSDQKTDESGRRVLYWHDPMVPGNRFDKPGKSPFMDMQLVPVYADDGADGGVRISPALQQNLGVRFATVERVDRRDSFDAIGTTQFDESAAQVVQSRTNGYIDKLYARSPMQRIKRGEPVASIFVPDWIPAQEEYLALKRSGNAELANAARQRMRAMSVPDSVIAQADRTGRSQTHMTLTSPVTGVVTELSVRDGAMVAPGMTIAKIAGLDKIWLVAEIPEATIGSIRVGMPVEAMSAADANRRYAGKVREILPGINTTSRTLQARLELDNRDGSLTPGQLMRIRLDAERPVSRLLVPTEAIIVRGGQSTVLVAGPDNSMQPAVVTTGRDIDDRTEIVDGLSEGQKIVASAQFLIDSEASLKSVLPKFRSNAPATTSQDDEGEHDARHDAANNIANHAAHESGHATMQDHAHASHPAPESVYRATGQVEKISAAAITFSHRPVAELQWGAMTMDFKKPQPGAFKNIAVGQQAEFSFRKTGDDYVLVNVKPVKPKDSRETGVPK